MRRRHAIGWVVSSAVAAGFCCSNASLAAPAADSGPRCADERLKLELVAEAPLVTTPIGMTFDYRGRLLVIESHTHFREEKYEGPPTDRIKILHDDDHDGRFDRSTIFFEGTRYTLNLAARPDGGLYVITRDAIRLIRDSDDDGRADAEEKIIRLETPTVDQHNGLSGFFVDIVGKKLYFGLGENYGANYRLVGSDSRTITGGGEGGHVFCCDLDGSELRQIATGFWNPFGLTRDAFGRIFATDNDPTSRPPNRLLHVVQGGDYGFQYQYGRSGLHPFIAWNGELPGTLGMAAGIGEAACHLIRYDSLGLPADYRDDLLIATWSDHGIERYRLSPNGATFVAKKVPFISGGIEFRPVSLATARDGSLYFTDWVAATYSVHHRGRIWHVRWPDAPMKASGDRAIQSLDRRTRELAAIDASGTADGRATLRSVLSGGGDDAVKATALSALIAVQDEQLNLRKLAASDAAPGLRRMAVVAMARFGQDVTSLLKLQLPPEVRAEVLRSIPPERELQTLLDALKDDDAWIRQAAIDRLAWIDRDWLDQPKLDARQRLGFLLSRRQSKSDPDTPLKSALNDPDPDVRFTALKWIADRRLRSFRPTVLAGLDEPDQSKRLFIASVAALERLDTDKVSDLPNPKILMSRAFDTRADPGVRATALSLLRSDADGLTVKKLLPLVAGPLQLQCEAVRLLGAMTDESRFSPLAKLAADVNAYADIRADAVAGLAAQSPPPTSLLLTLAMQESPDVRNEALRALMGVELDEGQKRQLRDLAARDPEAVEAVARLLGTGQPATPAVNDIAAWLKRTEGFADPNAGRRVFESARLGSCIRCHAMEGRGNRVGPDLSRVGQRSDVARGDRTWLLQSILEPSREMAPQFIPWLVISKDGQEQIGFALTKARDRETYADATGQTFTVKSADIVSTRELDVSIMPTGLLDAMTTQECRDLLAYLAERR